MKYFKVHLTFLLAFDIVTCRKYTLSSTQMLNAALVFKMNRVQLTFKVTFHLITSLMSVRRSQVSRTVVKSHLFKAKGIFFSTIFFIFLFCCVLLLFLWRKMSWPWLWYHIQAPNKFNSFKVAMWYRWTK